MEFNKDLSVSFQSRSLKSQLYFPFASQGACSYRNSSFRLDRKMKMGGNRTEVDLKKKNRTEKRDFVFVR